ncbi:hypothetical protein [Sinorhizobium sp. 22678]|uniref:hypothetical protein n=1 Tax=Sinorhizobium sp. 22678 TaxID=3453955 RepID=UPI003F859B0D
MKVFFDVDGVLIDGWHADIARRKPWDETIEVDLGVDRDAFQILFFGTPGNRSASPMFECVTGRRDLKQALAAILPDVGYKGVSTTLCVTGSRRTPGSIPMYSE